MNSNAELQAALWALYNEGKMPVEIRVEYKWYCWQMLSDDEFAAMVELPHDEKPLNYQGLPVVFDSWCKSPLIKTVPRQQ